MNLFHKVTVLVLSLTTGLILVGCGGGSSSTTESSTVSPETTNSTTTTTSSKVGQSKLSVYLTDAPVEFEAVYVTISEVLVHREGTDDESDSSDDTNSTEDTKQTETDEDDGEWIVVATPNLTYNLLELQNGVTSLMGEETLPSGDYTQLRMVLGNTPDGEPNILGNTHPHAHYIILDDDTAHALKVPSNTLKHVHNFTLVDGGETEMIIDFDAKKSIHEAGKSGKWLLQPVLKVKTELQ